MRNVRRQKDQEEAQAGSPSDGEGLGEVQRVPATFVERTLERPVVG